jgi:hypothetical protein
MPHWLLGSFAIGATCGWLCGMFLSPLRTYGRDQIMVLGAMIVIGAVLGAAFNIRAALGFGIAALVFYFLHAVWRVSRGILGSI